MAFVVPSSKVEYPVTIHWTRDDGQEYWSVYWATDTLAWATGTRVGAGDHATELFCSEYGCVLGLYSDTLRFEV